MKKIVALTVIFTLIATQVAYAAPHIMAKAGTEVLLKNIDKLNSKQMKEGQVVQFLAEKSVKDKNGNTLIEQGAMAYGTITAAESAGAVGSAGKLGLKFNSVKAFNDIDIPLSGTNDTSGHGNGGAVAGAAVAGLLFVPILLPVALFFRGSNAVIQSGTILRAYVAKDTVLVPGDEEAAQEAAEEEFAKANGFSGGSKKINNKLNDMLKAYDSKKEAENSFVPPTQPTEPTQPAENTQSQDTATPNSNTTTGD